MYYSMIRSVCSDIHVGMDGSFFYFNNMNIALIPPPGKSRQHKNNPPTHKNRIEITELENWQKQQESITLSTLDSPFVRYITQTFLGSERDNIFLIHFASSIYVVLYSCMSVRAYEKVLKEGRV